MSDILLEPISPDPRQLDRLSAALAITDLDTTASILTDELGMPPDTIYQLSSADHLPSKLLYLKNKAIKDLADAIRPHLMEEIVNNNVSLYYRALLEVQPQVFRRIVLDSGCRYNFTINEFIHYIRVDIRGRLGFREYTNAFEPDMTMDSRRLQHYIGEAIKYHHDWVISDILSTDTFNAALEAAAEHGRDDIFRNIYGRYSHFIADRLKTRYLNIHAGKANHAMVDYMLERGANPMALGHAAKAGDKVLIKRFLAHVDTLPVNEHLAGDYADHMASAIMGQYVEIFEMMYDFFGYKKFPYTNIVASRLIHAAIIGNQLDIYKLSMNRNSRHTHGNNLHYLIQYDRANFLPTEITSTSMEWERDLFEKFEWYITSHDYGRNNWLAGLGYNMASLVVKHPKFWVNFTKLFKVLHTNPDPAVILLFMAHAPADVPVEAYRRLENYLSHRTLDPVLATELILHGVNPDPDLLSKYDRGRYNVPLLRYMIRTQDSRLINIALPYVLALKDKDELFEELLSVPGLVLYPETFPRILEVTSIRNGPYLAKLVQLGQINNLDQLPSLAMRWQCPSLLQAIEASTADEAHGNYDGMLESAARQGDLHYVEVALARGATTIKAAKNAAKKHDQPHVWQYLEQRYPRVRTTWPRTPA